MREHSKTQQAIGGVDADEFKHSGHTLHQYHITDHTALQPAELYTIHYRQWFQAELIGIRNVELNFSSEPLKPIS